MDDIYFVIYNLPRNRTGRLELRTFGVQSGSANDPGASSCFCSAAFSFASSLLTSSSYFFTSGIFTPIFWRLRSPAEWHRPLLCPYPVRVARGQEEIQAMSKETKARNLEFMANKPATRLPCRNLATHEGQSSCEPRRVVMASRELRPSQPTFESKNSRPHLRSSVPDCSDQRPNLFVN